MYAEVCEHLELGGSEEDSGDGLALSSETSTSLSSGDLASLLRQWILRKGNVKVEWPLASVSPMQQHQFPSC